LAWQLVFTPLGVIGFFVVLLNLEGRQAELADKLQKVNSTFIVRHYALVKVVSKNLSLGLCLHRYLTIEVTLVG